MRPSELSTFSERLTGARGSWSNENTKFSATEYLTNVLNMPNVTKVFRLLVQLDKVVTSNRLVRYAFLLGNIVRNRARLQVCLSTFV